MIFLKFFFIKLVKYFHSILNFFLKKFLYSDFFFLKKILMYIICILYILILLMPVGPLARWPVGPLARWPVGPLARWPVGPLGFGLWAWVFGRWASALA